MSVLFTTWSDDHQTGQIIKIISWNVTRPEVMELDQHSWSQTGVHEVLSHSSLRPSATQLLMRINRSWDRHTRAWVSRATASSPVVTPGEGHIRHISLVTTSYTRGPGGLTTSTATTSPTNTSRVSAGARQMSPHRQRIWPRWAGPDKSDKQIQTL